MSLDVAKLCSIIEAGGLLSRAMPSFEARSEQQKMLQDIARAYNDECIALIEAGTGTGKSLAYILPALAWAILRKERTVISTHTINLQEQLVHKDLPFVIGALGVDIKAELVKGMANYLCLRKLSENGASLFDETGVMADIEAWSQKTLDGSYSDLPFPVPYAAWEKVACEADACNRKKCPFYEKCYFFKARNKAADAQILVVNHHLLFSDLGLRAEEDNYTDAALLPAYRNLILDEAHHIETVATSHFAVHMRKSDLGKTIGRLGNDRPGHNGRFLALKSLLLSHYKESLEALKHILAQIDLDMPAARREAEKDNALFFDSVQKFVELLEPSKNEAKIRLKPEHFNLPAWQELTGLATTLSRSLIGYASAMEAILRKIKDLGEETIDSKASSAALDINACCDKVKGLAKALTSLMSPTATLDEVRWLEVKFGRLAAEVSVSCAQLNVAPLLAKNLYARFPSIVLTSATLATGNSFAFLREQTGLTPEHLNRKPLESIYPSPFNFAKQALFGVCADMPDPTDASFTKEAIERIWLAIDASRGQTFVLFTSYSMLKTVRDALADKLSGAGYPLFCQGDTNRKLLLDKFKAADKAVLFGTDSFWEGVDVAGEKLRCVIIVKLPFQVPTEPVHEAKNELLISQGKDPFSHYALPLAIVKFKQGFGRLIRHAKDRGCILCLDRRLLTKPYGALFRKSLPNMSLENISKDKLHETMRTFYKKTYYLVAK